MALETAGPSIAAVFDAASCGDVSQLQRNLSVWTHLVDARHPLDGETVWHAAAKKGHADVIGLLARLESKSIDTPDKTGWTPLYTAACNGHSSVIEALVRLGSKAIDTPNKYGCTPMYAAASNGHVSAIELLIRLKSEAIDAFDKDGWTPLYAAARNGHVSVIETLVRLGSKAIDTPDNYGRTSVYAAALNGHVSVIETLVRLGSKAIDTPDNNGWTPMFAAAWKGLFSIIELLVRFGSKAIDTPTNNDGWTPMNAAASKGHVSSIETLVHLGSEAIDTPNNDGKTPMYTAASNGHVSAIEALVRLGSEAIDTPNNDGWTPLYAAAWNGHVSAIETLVRLGSKAIDTQVNDSSPLRCAFQRKQVDVIEVLVRLGSKAIEPSCILAFERSLLNNNGSTILHLCASRGSSDALANLVLLGSNAIDTPDNNGWTPMHEAASKGHAKVIEALIRLGSKAIDTPDNDGWTPLHAAAYYGHVKAVETLIHLGSKAIDSPDSKGTVPLNAAASNRHLSVIETLVRFGSKTIDTPNMYGWTPFHWAASNGHRAGIETLVQLGSRSIDTLNDQHATPLFLAAAKGHVDVIEELVRSGSQALDTANYSATPIYQAARNGNTSVVATLLRLGCLSIDTPSKRSGWTPLSAAFRARHKKIIELLIDAGADLIPSIQLLEFDALATEYRTAFLGLQIQHLYIPEARMLSFQNENLANQTAATLPLANWKSCRALDFRGNPNLTEIPVSLAVLDPNRTTEILFDPPTKWSSFEAQIIQAGDHRAIIDFAKLKAAGGSTAVKERKLMAVGPSAVGKTTLIRRLKDENYSHPLSTDGVDMGELIMPSDEEGEPMRIVVWDFAGQPLYRQTHLLFLRNPGLCLLLFKLTDDVITSVEHLRYWCESLRSMHTEGPFKSRVLLIGTHLDRCSSKINARSIASSVWQQMQNVFPDCIPDQPVLVSCAAGPENYATIRELRETIRRVALAMDIRAPACIEVVRKALLQVMTANIPVLTSEAAYEVIGHYALKHGYHQLSSDPHLQDICLRMLHMLGSIIAVEERGTITHVVANPQWVALLLATVVTTRHTWVTRGRVTFGVLSSQIWRGNARFPPETHRLLVVILEQMQILLPVNKNRGELLPSDAFFVPGSLPEQCHIQFFPRDAVPPLRRLFVTVERSVPRGVVPQIVAQLLSLPNPKVIAVWQHGGIFRFKQPFGRTDVSVQRQHSDTIEVIIWTSTLHSAADWSRKLSTIVERELNHMNVEVRAPCVPFDDACYVLLNELRKNALLHQLEFQCGSAQHSRRIDRVAPDLLFADLDQAFVHPWESIATKSELGRGASGRVMHCQLTSASSTTDVAVKLLEQLFDNETALIQEFQHEAFLMSQLQHPNIVRFVGICLPTDQPQVEHQEFPGLIMEVVDGGTLYEFLNDPVGLLKIAKLADSIVDAVNQFNSRTNLHEANPAKFSAPPPLTSLDQLCNGALGLIDQLFERLLARGVDEQIVQQVNEMRQSLHNQLQEYFAKAESAQHNQAVNQCIDAIKELASRINDVLVPIDWPLRLKLATDLAQALTYMHSLNPPMVHRDFKSPNVFLTCRLDAIDLKNIDWSKPLAKVGDFGLSILLIGTDRLGERMTTINPTWAAPEVFLTHGYGTSADVYAMGITMWELLAREHPFSNISMAAVQQHVKNGGRPLIPSGFLDKQEGRGFSSLIRRCWDPVPEQRPPMNEVYSILRDLSRGLAPELFSELKPVHSPLSSSITAQRSYVAHQTQDIQQLIVDIGSNPTTPLKVLSLQAIDTCVWAGLSSGIVAVLQLFDDSKSHPDHRWKTCLPADGHLKGVSALKYNPALQSSMWSGSEDGRILVWKAELTTFDEAKAACFLKSKFTLTDTNITALKNLKDQQVHCVLRNGLVYLYLDEHTGPSCFELDLCSPTVTTRNQEKYGLSIATNRSHLVLRSDDESEAAEWQRSIEILQRVAVEKSGLQRLAASPQLSFQGLIISFEVTNDATWCLAQTSLVEWQLLETQHGLNSRLRLEPARQLSFEMDGSHFSEPRLRTVCGLVWVAPDILWLGAANALVTIDIATEQKHSHVAQSELIPRTPAEIQSVWSTPRICPSCFQDHYGSCGIYFAQFDHPISAQIPLLRSQADELPSFEEASSDQARCVDCKKSFNVFRWRYSCPNCNSPLCKKCLKAATVRCKNCPTRRAIQQVTLTDSSNLSSLFPRNTLALQWPSTGTHNEAIQLMAFVESKVSPSGFEVWTYAFGEDLLVWHTPIMSSEESPISPHPVLTGRVSLGQDVPLLMCMKQVGNQVWAGTRQGTIIGWDIATRSPLESLPLPPEMKHIHPQTGAARPTSAISVAQVKKHRSWSVFSSGHEPTLRRYTLVPQ